MTIDWISESERLPRIGQNVLFIHPRQTGEFWNLSTAWLAARHEAVCPHPVAPGGDWPTDFYWSLDRRGKDVCLVTGNGWWAELDQLTLPPGAEWGENCGYRFVRQIGECFVPPYQPEAGL